MVNPLNRLKMALPFALLFHFKQFTEHWTHSEFGKWFKHIVLMCLIWYINIYIYFNYNIYFTFAIRCILNNIPKWNALFQSNLFSHSIRHLQIFYSRKFINIQSQTFSKNGCIAFANENILLCSSTGVCRMLLNAFDTQQKFPKFYLLPFAHFILGQNNISVSIILSMSFSPFLHTCTTDCCQYMQF